jgi:streptogramin lyase
MTLSATQSAGGAPGGIDRPEDRIESTESDERGPYTGVALIHGIGDQKRNETLQEALNALTFWFNQRVDLSQRPVGTGRVWLRTRLTDDANPDARASSATLDLVAADAANDALDGPSGLRLRFREVWWAESFGLPKVGDAIRWARVQFREQLAHILIPVGFQLGPTLVARRAPAREISQAGTYRPGSSSQPRDMADASSAAQDRTARAGDLEKRGDSAGMAGRARRIALRAVLWLYDLIQYVWKLAQWIVLAPVIGLLLLLLGPVRLLARIPILRTSLTAGFSALVEYVMLHWIASMQIYVQDYTRSSAIRQRFEREFAAFLDDPDCERIVVIAHSMGTVIAYEGLTSVLAARSARQAGSGGDEQEKPITFICLGAALRRVWLLARTDPDRLRGALPDDVRWLHFWGRYDPVSTGPLTRQSVARVPVKNEADQERAEKQYAALCDRLDRCENVDVANRDSIFTDHTTYWENLEQVVGPIALELVRGHATLERTVQERLATTSAVLGRRWRVAWRALVALGVGLGVATLLLILQFVFNVGVGSGVITFVNGLLGSAAVQTFLTDNIPFYSSLRGLASPTGIKTLTDLANNQPLLIVYLVTHYVTAELVVAVLTALVALGIGIELTTRIIAPASPFVVRDVVAQEEPRLGLFTFAVSLLAVAVACATVVAIVAAVDINTINSTGQSTLPDPRNLPLTGQLFLWATAIAQPVALVVLALSFIIPIRARHWVWPIAIILMWGAGSSNDLFYRTLTGLALVTVAFIGVSQSLSASMRGRSRSWLGGLTLGAIVIGLTATFLVVSALPFYFYDPVEPLFAAPLVVYGLWAGTRSQSGAHPERGMTFRVTTALGVLTLVYLLNFLPFGEPLASAPRLVFMALLAGVIWSIALIRSARAERRVWLAAIPLLTIAVFALCVTFTLQQLALLPVDEISNVIPLSWSLALLVPGASYGLWAGASALRPLVRRQGLRAPVGFLQTASIGAAVIVLVAPLLAWPTLSPRLLDAIVASQRIVVFQVPNAFDLGAIAAGPDGALWFTKDGTIGRVTTRGEFTEYPAAAASPFGGIVAGPDGALWFSGEGIIGRITPSGSVTEFPVQNEMRAGPITAGPDGNLWFTDSESGAIGRITPSGSVTEFSVGCALSRSKFEGIAFGPDGNVWFTMESGFISDGTASGCIGDITLNGQIRQSILFGGNLAGAIVAGSDGALWFTELGKIGRVTTEGKITEFPAAAASAFGSIVVGPDGALWFTEYIDNSAGKVGRITPSGSVTEFDVGSDTAPQGIAKGSDGNLWFTEYYGNRIGRIKP